ncbi:MAG: hypothetical protein K2X66_09880 [Cyanobacteria bacterium]|nr:hypothetical protein [Cyanobacteriota bacterium]
MPSIGNIGGPRNAGNVPQISAKKVGDNTSTNLPAVATASSNVSDYNIPNLDPFGPTTGTGVVTSTLLNGFLNGIINPTLGAISFTKSVAKSTSNGLINSGWGLNGTIGGPSGSPPPEP